MAGIGEIAGICASINRDRDRDRDSRISLSSGPFWDWSSENAGSPPWDNVGLNLNSLFIMNSAGEEDEEQVDYGEDSGEENSMSFNGQARSNIWRRMLCSRCIPADLLPGFGLTVNIEILRVTNVAGTGTIAVDPELR